MTCRYIFPGLALGAHLGDTKIVTDNMIMAVAEALPKMLSDEERKKRAVYPDLKNIRTISANMAVEVRLDVLLALSEECTACQVKSPFYKPFYQPRICTCV
jgi:malic enzyme